MAARPRHRVPGYTRLRRWFISRARTSRRLRHAARVIYPDLVEQATVDAERESWAKAEEQRRDELRAELRERRIARVNELTREKEAALADQRERLSAERNARVHQVKREAKEQVRALRSEHARVLRDAGYLIPDPDDTSIAVSAGDLVGGGRLTHVPLVVFDVRGVDAATATDVLEEIAIEQVLGCAFRPIFLSDLPDAAPWQRYGHLCELVPAAVETADTTSRAAGYLADRLEIIRSSYDARWYLRVAPSGFTPEQRELLLRLGR